MEYNYIIGNGNHLVEIEGKLYLIDTGCPDSFSFSKPANTVINGREYSLPKQKSLNHENVNSLVGKDVAGFIGRDILKDTGSIVFDKDRKIIEFGSAAAEREDSIGLINRGYLAIKVLANNKEYIASFDTGAMINYIDGDVPHERKIYDYNTQDVNMNGYAGHLDVMICGRTFNLEFGDMSQMPEMSVYRQITGMFLGINGLFEHKLEINFRDLFINLD